MKISKHAIQVGNFRVSVWSTPKPGSNTHTYKHVRIFPKTYRNFVTNCCVRTFMECNVQGVAWLFRWFFYYVLFSLLLDTLSSFCFYSIHNLIKAARSGKRLTRSWENNWFECAFGLLNAQWTNQLLCLYNFDTRKYTINPGDKLWRFDAKF